MSSVGGFMVNRSLFYPQNHLLALEEIQMLFTSLHISLEHLFDILLKSNGGWLDFSFGDLTVQFAREFEVFSDEDAIRITIELHRENSSKTVSYQFNQKELKTIKAINSWKTQKTRRQSK